jgi:hypothetical protein
VLVRGRPPRAAARHARVACLHVQRSGRHGPVSGGCACSLVATCACQLSDAPAAITRRGLDAQQETSFVRNIASHALNTASGDGGDGDHVEIDQAGGRSVEWSLVFWGGWHLTPRALLACRSLWAQHACSQPQPHSHLVFSGPPGLPWIHWDAWVKRGCWWGAALTPPPPLRAPPPRARAVPVPGQHDGAPPHPKRSDHPSQEGRRRPQGASGREVACERAMPHTHRLITRPPRQPAASNPGANSTTPPRAHLATP